MNPSLTSSNSGGRKAAASSLAMAGLAQERAALYSVLATLFRCQPSRDTLLSLRTPELREALQQAGMALEEDFFDTDIEALADTLAVEYANLFLLPGVMISPHESVQLRGGSGLLRGPETARVREYYEYVGFHVDESTPMEPDHVSIELEFLGHLAAEETAAWDAQNVTTAIDALRYQNDFLRRHLGQWIYDFLKLIENNAEHVFYRELALLTAAMLEDQQESLPQFIAQLETRHATS